MAPAAARGALARLALALARRHGGDALGRAAQDRGAALDRHHALRAVDAGVDGAARHHAPGGHALGVAGPDGGVGHEPEAVRLVGGARAGRGHELVEVARRAEARDHGRAVAEGRHDASRRDHVLGERRDGRDGGGRRGGRGGRRGRLLRVVRHVLRAAGPVRVRHRGARGVAATHRGGRAPVSVVLAVCVVEHAVVVGVGVVAAAAGGVDVVVQGLVGALVFAVDEPVAVVVDVTRRVRRAARVLRVGLGRVGVCRRADGDRAALVGLVTVVVPHAVAVGVGVGAAGHQRVLMVALGRLAAAVLVVEDAVAIGVGRGAAAARVGLVGVVPGRDRDARVVGVEHAVAVAVGVGRVERGLVAVAGRVAAVGLARVARLLGGGLRGGGGRRRPLRRRLRRLRRRLHGAEVDAGLLLDGGRLLLARRVVGRAVPAADGGEAENDRGDGESALAELHDDGTSSRRLTDFGLFRHSETRAATSGRHLRDRPARADAEIE